MKRFWTGLLALCMIFLLLPTQAVAAEESRSYDFSLTVNGKNEVQAQPGDVLTVMLMLHRTDQGKDNKMYAMQDEIGYDDTFFEVLPGSLLLNDGIESRDLAMQSGGRALYLNYLSRNGGVNWDRDTLVGSFQVKVRGQRGTSQLHSENCRVSTQDGSGSYTTAAQNLTVIVTTDCVVHFETNGGSKIKDLSVQYGEKIDRPTDPVREGYWLEGWYRDVNLTQRWDFAKDKVQGNMTLYASWKEGTAPAPGGPNTGVPWQWKSLLLGITALVLIVALLMMRKKTVVFLLDEANEWMSVQVKRGARVLRPADPTRAGYTFGGWYQDSACTKPWDFDTDVVKTSCKLYAKWEQPTEQA